MKTSVNILTFLFIFFYEFYLSSQKDLGQICTSVSVLTRNPISIERFPDMLLANVCIHTYTYINVHVYIYIYNICICLY